MKRRARPEQAIHRALMMHVTARAMPSTFTFHVSNGGARSPIEAAILKGLGVTAGVPDLLSVKDGQLYALELKAPGGRLSAAQRDAIASMQAAGAVVAHDPRSALSHLERWNHFARSRPMTIREQRIVMLKELVMFDRRLTPACRCVAFATFRLLTQVER